MDGQDDIPFGPQPGEQVPLVVPDLTPIPRPKKTCSATTKAGHPCTTPCIQGQDVCMGHSLQANADQRQEWSKKSQNIRRMRTYTIAPKNHQPLTKEQLLALLSHRLEKFIERFGDVPTPETEEVICEIARTYAICSKIDGADAAEKLGWRMKGAV